MLTLLIVFILFMSITKYTTIGIYVPVMEVISSWNHLQIYKFNKCVI